jgi:branched-chain amino acid transport system ATP-binding protein
VSFFECAGVSAGYGVGTVVRELDIVLERGEVLALLGPNGAGKSTTLCTLAGLHPRSAGTVRVDGVHLPSGRPRAATKAGVVLVPDDRALFRSLTVSENLELAAVDRARIDDALELFPQLTTRLDVRAGLLSGGEQQMLAIGRALVQAPSVLLIDELSMGLAPVIVQNLLPTVRRAAKTHGIAVVLVEQHVALALSVADRAIVLTHGAVTLSGDAQTLAADTAAVEAAYLGVPVQAPPEESSDTERRSAPA